MNILAKVTWKAMWKNRTRTIVTIIGIILSAAMFTAVTTMGISFREFMIQNYVYTQGDYFLQLNYATQAQADALRQQESVTQFADYQLLGFLKTQEDSNGEMSTFLLAAADDTFFETMPVHLSEGRLPQNSGEIVLPKEILQILEYYGMGTQVGQTITMDLITQYDGYSSEDIPNDVDAPFTKTYTIVGIAAGEVYGDYDLRLYSMLTYADGNQGSALWHRLFAKTSPASAAVDLVRHDKYLNYGLDVSINHDLLNLYGVTKYTNYNAVILSLCAILCAIIMVGSISLIYNAFSISVSERTKQFGLLSSIGATKKQLRRSVFYEAFILCGFGIPLGLASGYGGIAVTLALLRRQLDSLISVDGGAVTLQAVCSPLALGAAGIIAIVTVLISAAIPARRATKVTPLDAIRQTQDYRARAKDVKVSKLTQRLFGFPGVMARKYYKVSRKKYRATIISLAVSILLFISAASFSLALRSTVENTVQPENYDIRVYGSKEEMAALRSQSFVSKSAYLEHDSAMAYVPDEALSQEFLNCWDEMSQYLYSDISKNIRNIQICFLEDDALLAFLQEQGINPAPYFDKENPTALVCRKHVTTYSVPDENGNWIRYTFEFDPFDEDTEQLMLFQNQIPQELEYDEDGNPGITNWEYVTGDDGQTYLNVSQAIFENGSNGAYVSQEIQATYQVQFDTNEDGSTVGTFYLYDGEKGTISETPSAVEVFEAAKFRLGETIDTLPFGIDTDAQTSSYSTTVILPFSAAPAEFQDDPYLYFNVSDYSSARAYMAANFEEHVYTDYRASQEHSRTLLLLINVFSYGFIVLISLICIANVFNTISTNVSLRRRDFGMLKSVGLHNRGLYQMMHYECLIYGIKSLLFGLPLSLAASYGISMLTAETVSDGFDLPWGALVTAVICIFAVVFCTMLYAVSKLRRDNPIDAIRMDNL